MPFTDLHSHILPGCDDGADDDEEFLEMAGVAVRGGTALMVATPHYDIECPDLELEEVPPAVGDHLQLLRSRDIPLELVPGIEVRINAGLFQLAKEGCALDRLTLGGKGRYILVDLPLADLPLSTPDILFQIQLCGLTPILAHPERNRYLVEHPAVVRGLVERGVEIQVNSGSLEGLYGKAAKRAARALLKEGASRLVASDAHKPRGRSPDLSGAAGIIRRQMGAEAARIILEINPGRVLAGGDLVDAAGKSPHRSGSARLLARRRSA